MIETNGLILRHWKSKDFEHFYKINSHPKVCQYLPKTLTRSESDSLANKIIQSFNTQGFGLFALEIKKISQFIGFTGLNEPNMIAPFMPAIEIAW